MGGIMPVIGTALNPIGAVAPKTGIGQALDPAAAIARKFSPGMQDWIDPAGGMREGGFQNKAMTQTYEERQKQQAAQTGSGKTGKSLLVSG
jgi:hypothetical protein